MTETTHWKYNVFVIGAFLFLSLFRISIFVFRIFDRKPWFSVKHYLGTMISDSCHLSTVFCHLVSKPSSALKDQRSEVGSRELTEVGSRRSEVGNRKRPEIGGQKSEVGNRKRPEIGCPAEDGISASLRSATN